MHYITTLLEIGNVSIHVNSYLGFAGTATGRDGPEVKTAVASATTATRGTTSLISQFLHRK